MERTGPPCTYWIPTISGKLTFSTMEAHAFSIDVYLEEKKNEKC